MQRNKGKIMNKLCQIHRQMSECIVIQTEKELKRLQASKDCTKGTDREQAQTQGRVSIRTQVGGFRSPRLRAGQGSELSNAGLKNGPFQGSL